MFPHIQHIDDLLAKIAHKPELRVIEHANGFKTVCYMIANEKTFDDYWARECRGITFFPTGEIASRSMHKFFNVGEREETQEHALDFSKIMRVMDKRDGSMIHPVPTVDKQDFVMKSKKSFESAVAVEANIFAHADKKLREFIMRCIAVDVTPTFEFTSPYHRIVLNYDKPELKLLHIRENVTGRYLHGELLRNICDSFKIPLVDYYEVEYDFLKNQLDSAEGIEGYVVQFESGEMVKLKTKWYLELHHSVVFPTRRSIARMVINETIDDYKSYMSQVGADQTQVLEIERMVTLTINVIRQQVEQITAEAIQKYSDDRKSVAINLRGHQFFSLIMKKYSGVEPEYTAFYDKHVLENQFSTLQV
jgi:RNA ligase